MADKMLQSGLSRLKSVLTGGGGGGDHQVTSPVSSLQSPVRSNVITQLSHSSVSLLPVFLHRLYIYKVKGDHKPILRSVLISYKDCLTVLTAGASQVSPARSSGEILLSQPQVRPGQTDDQQGGML